MFNSFLFYYGLPLYNKTKDLMQNIYISVYKTYNDIMFGLNSDILIFTKNNDHPYFEYFFDNNSVTIWKYNRYTKLFYNYNCATKDIKRFPLLSASIGIMKDDKFISHFNLDEFIDTVYIESSNCGYPTLTQFIYAYMYTNKVLLNKTDEYYINYLDTCANEFIKKIFVEDFDFLSEKK
jgi:hypothetical protein